MEAANRIQKAVRRRQSMDSNMPAAASASSEMVSTKRSECVQVALVVRPLLSHEPPGSECLRQTEVGKPEVVLDCAPFPFAFDHVSGPSSGVASVYDACVAPALLPNVIRGCNATVLAYGQTGSGKTHAMGSGAQASRVPGLIQMTVAQLFRQLPEGATARACFVQIYEDSVHDLLAPPLVDGELSRLSLKRDSGGWSLPAARRELVESAADVTALLARGTANRTTGCTKMNEHSSRSHAVLSIEMRMADTGAAGQPAGPGGAVLRPKLTFVDLAGSERTKRAGTEGKAQHEGIQINLSLFHLNHVIHALGSRAAHIPYNGSSLTKLLADRLGGSTQTLMLACASPAESNALETLSTLYTVSRARTIVSKPRVARVASERLTPEEAARQVEEARLKAEETLRRDNAELRIALEASERLRREAERRAACGAVARAAVAGVLRRVAAEERALLERKRTQAEATLCRLQHEAAAAVFEQKRLAAALKDALKCVEAAEQAARSSPLAPAPDASLDNTGVSAVDDGAQTADEGEEGEPPSAKRQRGVAARANKARRVIDLRGPGVGDYDPQLASSTLTTDFGASRVDRFSGPGSIYAQPTSMQAAGPLTTVDINRGNAGIPLEPAKRATRANARQASFRV